MSIEEMIREYRISLQENDMLRAYEVKTEEERKMLADAKPQIIEYFKNKEIKKNQEAAELLKKARHGEDGLYLVIEHDTYGVYIGSARRLTEEEKKGHSDWYAESAFCGRNMKKAEYLTFKDMPKRKSDGTFSGGLDGVWILTPEEYDRYIQIDAERAHEKAQREAAEKAAEESRRQKEIKEKEELVSKVDEWIIKERQISDEGGKTKLYTHHFSIGGESLDYIERNMFDVGVVINPAYNVMPGVSGGIAIMKDGTLEWNTIGENGWHPVRPLTDNEIVCYTIIAKYGKFANTIARM